MVGESTPQKALEKSELKAEKEIARELDVSAKDVDTAIREVANSA